MGEEANEERAQQIYEKSVKIEQQFGDVLTGRNLDLSSGSSLSVLACLAVIDEETLGDVYDRICDVIEREQSLDHVWVPSKDKL